MTDKLCIFLSGNAAYDELSTLLKVAFDRAMRSESYVSQDCLSVPGMSGVRYRMLINNLIRTMHRPRYLEIGSWAGSTVCSVMDANTVEAVCIDNWSQFGGPKDQFFMNTARFKSSVADMIFIEDDFRTVDVKSLGLFNVYLFDGPHEEKDQYDGLFIYKDALENNIVFIVDDWNWAQVRTGTLNAIRDTGYRIDFSIEVRTTMDESHGEVHGERGDWHNGYFLGKLSRTSPRW